MKKTLIAMVVLLMAASLSAQGIGDLKGKMAVGGFINYGIGFGKMFDDYEETFEDFTVKNETSLGISFGGKFLYGLAPKMAVAASVDRQSIKYKGEASGDLGGFEDIFNYDETESWIAINVNGVYFFSPEKKMCPYAEAGPGYYMPSHEDADSKFGINGGLGILYMVSPTVGVDLGGRFHMIFTEEEKTNYAEIHGGVNVFFGGTK
ncbi:MAG: outer membrane beta-barrel protein [bacterium]|nr:outer membrane beta-barrel protein [bacterium]